MANRFTETLSRIFRPDQYARQKSIQVTTNLLDMWERNRPLADVWDLKSFVEDGYRRNTLIFACVTKIATTYAQPKLMAWTRNSQDNEVDLPKTSPLVTLLNNPAGPTVQGAAVPMARSEFFRSKKVHEESCGASYILKVRAGSRLPIALKLLRPDVIYPVSDSRGELAAWSYGKQAANGTYSDAQLAAGVPDPTGQCQIIPARDVIHEISYPDPLEPFKGLSPIAVLARMGDIDNFAGDYLRAFFLNAGVPSALLKYKDIVGDVERGRAKTKWRENYGGTSGKWHDLAILDGDVEYQEIGSKVQTLDLANVFGQTESRICMSYGIPPVLIGTWLGLFRSTFSNYDSSRVAFYQETMQPKWAFGGDRLTADLAKEFGDYIEIGFDLDSVDALQAEKKEGREFAIHAWDSDLLMENECREIIGSNKLKDAEGNRYKSEKIQANAVDMLRLQGQQAASQARAADQAQGQEGQLGAPMMSMTVQRRAAAGEAFSTKPPAWRVLHGLADSAAVDVKKNS